MQKELVWLTPNLEDEVIFGQGFLPLAFVKPITNYKAAKYLYPRQEPSLGTISRDSWTQVFYEVVTPPLTLLGSLEEF